MPLTLFTESRVDKVQPGSWKKTWGAMVTIGKFIPSQGTSSSVRRVFKDYWHKTDKVAHGQVGAQAVLPRSATLFTEHKVRGHERVGWRRAWLDARSSVTFCMDAVYSDLSLNTTSESESTRATLDYLISKQDYLLLLTKSPSLKITVECSPHCGRLNDGLSKIS